MNAHIESVAQAVRAHPDLATTAEETMTGIFRRSTTDIPFRMKLVSDPRAALTEFAGHPIPENLNLKFIEKQGDMTIVLPAAVDAAAELNDAELEMVAGGSPVVIPLIVASSLECGAGALALAAAIVSWFD